MGRGALEQCGLDDAGLQWQITTGGNTSCGQCCCCSNCTHTSGSNRCTFTPTDAATAHCATPQRASAIHFWPH